MIHLLLAAALAAAPAPAPAADQHQDHAQHEGMKDDCCKMDCCKGEKKMACCDKMKKTQAPAAEGHDGHEHAH
ncbi:hypothetical protein [Sphingomonas humi]|uniref:Uncharacterized protein n=1 Tax=Sphingomonas humi TaxID=335630 RepID=A0ABP7SF51_9SPHN